MFVAHRLLPMLLLLPAIAPIGLAADSSEPDPLDGIRALIKQGKPAEAESGAGELLANIFETEREYELGPVTCIQAGSAEIPAPGQIFILRDSVQ